MILGVHVSTAGKIYEAFKRARALNCNTMQIFSRSPQQWRQHTLDPEDVKQFVEETKKGDIKPIFVHIPYLINLASPNPRLYKVSIEAYIEDIKEAGALGVDYIVTHMGSHKETSEPAGLRRLTKALKIILNKTADIPVGILLENTAGSGSWLGYKFSHQRKVIQKLKSPERVGLCLDTAHAYLAGYDLSQEEGLSKLIEDIDKSVGIKLIKLIHLNDAKGKLGCGHDRHDHIGKGSIGRLGLKRIINHPKLRNIPFILETPKDSEESDLENLTLVRKLRKE